MIRVIIAEDHLMVRAGLRVLLEKAGDIIVLAEAGNGQEAIELAEKLRPDLLILDIMMPRLNGIEAAERMRDLNLPFTHTLLLSMHVDPGLVRRALQSGVKGYVLKSSVSDELIRAVRATARGEIFLSAPIAAFLSNPAAQAGAPGGSDSQFDSLSPREKEILQLIAEEHTSAEIAEILVISEKTVEKHRANLMEKLSARNLAGLVRLAVKWGLVDRDSRSGGIFPGNE